MNENILEIAGACKFFGGLKAVNDVSFTVTRGEILGIAGPNGSGKSTLFNLITGVPFGPTAGEVRFMGERIDRWPAHRISRAGLVRTFQKDAEFPALSADETLLVSATYNGRLSRTEAEARIEDALRSVDFGRTRRSMPSRELSVYEKKQLMIASALISKPALLMLDEPASGLTKPEIQRLDDLLVAVNRSGITVLLIEHVLSLLLSVSQRLIVLNQGSVLAAGDPHDVVRNPQVIEAYLGGRS
ncbi:MAG: ABC transporter ATP-binding protein [Aquamicrobium sp.]|jgi:branched-chain amino acid transport system ATP-binding protein|uniref:ABC transporter ATP-binding protein n=1 Tax=Mesorhizobium sp. Pch-S TaxID=2082387 RepID=UPI001010345E|nr:ABC transporter ATP-binding protein [Mesorhizobium sp. Pch-S]MBR2689009.1 ABC transporter ATP-binding protein [Aquamicrobium sp.]QAZ44841.1 ABC transporter ATP-binding protein [Mesorhizobium sp. Pch-S]